jgi:hypothetical protein
MNIKNIFAAVALLMTLNVSCQQAEVRSAANQTQPINLRVISRLPNQIIESSGIAISGSNRIWSHEDSGNANEIYCFDSLGNLLRTLIITNVENTDWEDMAVDSDENWFIGDFGNNNNTRTDLAIYKIPDPESVSGNYVSAEIIHFSFEDQIAFPPPSSNRNYDVEAMIWRNDSLYLFTKDRSSPFTGITKMYVLPASPGTHIARLLDSRLIGNAAESGRITSADINHHTGELVLLTNTKMISFTNYPGNRFFDGDVIEYIFTTTPGQNEAIAFVSSHKLYMTEEGGGSTAGYLYEILLPQPQSVPESDFKMQALWVYPNPANNYLIIPDDPGVEKMLYNAAGQIVKIFSKTDDVLDISDLRKGLYFIMIQQKDEKQIGKFLKQ